VRDLIASDKRFFDPMPETPAQQEPTDGGSEPVQGFALPTDHNYNDNTELVEAIKNGARGAYSDILHQTRGS